MPLNEFPVKVSLPVLWGDQDMFGHVNNCIYIRWLECSRVAYWDQGVRSVMSLNDCGPILANINCNYKKQVRYPDTVHIGSRIIRVSNSSMTMEHTIYSDVAQAIAAEGHSIVVLFDYETQRPIRISKELRQAIEATEGHEVPKN